MCDWFTMWQRSGTVTGNTCSRPEKQQRLGKEKKEHKNGKHDGTNMKHQTVNKQRLEEEKHFKTWQKKKKVEGNA